MFNLKEGQIPRFTGNYFLVLCWLSIANIIYGWIFSDKLYLDLSCLIWYWLGSSLKKKSNTARSWVIVIAVFICLILFMGLFSDSVSVSFGGKKLTPLDDLFWLASVCLSLVFVLPALLLLTKSGKAAFDKDN